MLGNQEIFINCLDLDGTITSQEFDNYLRDTKKLTSLAQILPMIKELIGESAKPEDLVARVINDTSCGLFARTIKASIAKGHYQAITTFNMSIEYIHFALALFGLTEDELQKIYIKYRTSPTDNVVNKNEYIIDAIKHFNLWENRGDLNLFVSLVDDNADNCLAAQDKGVEVFLVEGDKSYGHLRAHAKYLKLQDNDLKVSLPSAQERFQTAKKILKIDDIKVEPVTADNNSLKRVIGHMPTQYDLMEKKVKSESSLSKMVGQNTGNIVVNSVTKISSKKRVPLRTIIIGNSLGDSKVAKISMQS